MSKFKIGDKVRVFKKSGCDVNFNDKKVILTINEDDSKVPNCLKPNGETTCVDEDRLELVLETNTLEINIVSNIDELKILGEKVNKAAVKLNKAINKMNKFKLKLNK